MKKVGYAILLENGTYHCAAHGYIATLYKTLKGVKDVFRRLRTAKRICAVYIQDTGEQFLDDTEAARCLEIISSARSKCDCVHFTSPEECCEWIYKQITGEALNWEEA